MTSRLGKHFLRRLRRACEIVAIDRAIETGILVAETRIIGNREAQIFAPGPAVDGKSEIEIARMLERRGGRTSGSDRADIADLGDANQFTLSDEGVLVCSAVKQQVPSPAGTRRTKKLDKAERQALIRHLVRMVRRSANLPNPVDVATALMVAEVFDSSSVKIENALRPLKFGSPIVAITCEVTGFGQRFVDLLRRGIILPGKVATCRDVDILHGNRIRFEHIVGPARRIIVFHGKKYDADDVEALEQRIGWAAQSSYPILGVAETVDWIPRTLRKAAQMNLACGGLTMPIVRDTLKAVVGEAPESVVHYRDYAHLHLSDLAVAIRPGVSAYRALDILDGLAEARTREAKAGESGAGDSGNDSGRKSSTATSVTKNGRGNPGSGSEIIVPVKPADTDRDRFVFRVETLSGYGEAKDWALGLKSDLVLWRAGKLAWEDLSTKLLLSGPPGTGKTIFARALGNTLQVPLIVSSVASWLEPGYLGDVLKRMSAAFAEAEAHKPAILFIDEFDGIGQRGTTGDWVSYWNSVVNRLLELLDGAAKTDGVIIVGATNNAAIIDAALLRSGRLEKHVEIPRPDTAALIGILRHHLGDDLATVVDSAPLQFPSDGATAESTPATDLGLPITTGNENPAPAKQASTRKETR